jgi:hypothetical protein
MDPIIRHRDFLSYFLGSLGCFSVLKTFSLFLLSPGTWYVLYYKPEFRIWIRIGSVFNRASGSGSGSVFVIRIRIQEGKNDPQK